MITLLRKSPILGTILFTFLLAGVCWFYTMGSELNWSSDFSLQASLLSILIYFIQALGLRFVLKQNRVLLNHHFLAVFFYLYFAIKSNNSLALDYSILIPFFIIGIIHLMFQLYNKEESSNSLMGIGTLLASSIIVDPAMALLIPATLIGLSYFLVLDFRKMLLVLYFCFLGLLLGTGIGYLLGKFNFENWVFGINSNTVTELSTNLNQYTWYGVVLVFGLLFILIRNQHLSMRSVKIRNQYHALIVFIPFVLLYYFFTREVNINQPALLAIPLTAIYAYYFENASKPLFYESIFGIILLSDLFTKWYFNV